MTATYLDWLLTMDMCVCVCDSVQEVDQYQEFWAGMMKRIGYSGYD